MSFNMLDAVRSVITPDLLSKAAGYLGESESAVQKAVSALVPASLLGIAQQAEAGGASMIMDLAKKAMSNGFPGNIAASFTAGGEGIPESSPGMLSSLFGDKVGGIANAIAQFAGIKGASVASLLGSIVPMIVGLLGKQTADHGLNAAALASMLSSEKAAYLTALPAGLSIPGLTGASGASHPPAHQQAAHQPAVQSTSSGSWLMPLLLGLAAVALLLYIFKGCSGEHKQDLHHENAVVPATTPPPAAPIPAARESVKVKLADGTEINAYKGGIEDRLVTCLNDSSCIAGKEQWFDFDNINFETGSAMLTAESISQVRNIVAILKAYPAAKIKIGGYTDKVGNEEENKKLSQERADAVLTEILKEGANKAQLTGAEGYGETLAKMPETASDEERRADRRISVQLREK
ncbi:OmpA family protein [Flavihumibacter sp. CACIAM 22H1]|uniref:OmpA family protein n=1 Tax=Flavihumibacter sp. CACIAM 22H1 TaxID=1812911 RepID=UPI000A7F19D5|nr:OmpA family protein [Flavihumibacter sp. CACIAM 22H1]